MKSKSHIYDLGADVVRVVAGAAVLLIHSTDRYLVMPSLSAGISGEVLTILNMFGKIAVPLFVILSGYLLLREEKMKDTKQFYKKRLTHVIIPFIAWVIIYFWWMWYWGHYTITPLFVVKTVLSASIIHLYFLPLIGLLYLITPFLSAFLFSKSFKQQVVFCVVFLLGGLLLHFLGYLSPFLNLENFILTIGIPYLGFYVFGAIARRLSFNVWGKVGLTLLIALSLVTSLLLRHGSMSSYFAHPLSFFVMLESMSIFLLLISFSNDMKKYINGVPLQLLRYVSSTIFGIYLIHVIVIDVIGDKIAIFNPYTIHSPILFYAILYFAVGFIVSCGIVSIGKQIPVVKQIFG